MVSIICYTNNTRTLEHSYFTSSQLLRQDISSTTIFQCTDDILSGSFYLVCTLIVSHKEKENLRRSFQVMECQGHSLLPIQIVELFLKSSMTFLQCNNRCAEIPPLTPKYHQCMNPFDVEN